MLRVDEHAIIRFYLARHVEPLAQEIRVDEASDESAIASTHYDLPCQQFDELWTNIFYDTNIKNEVGQSNPDKKLTC